MNIDQKPYTQSEPTKCSACKNFYASEDFKGLCSTCYKKSAPEKNEVEIDNLRKESVDTQPQLLSNVEQKIEQIKQIEQGPKQTDKKRCFNCKKKVGLLGIECKCGFVYCNTHRLPEQHACSYNHKQVAKERLKSALVKVYNGKVADI